MARKSQKKITAIIGSSKMTQSTSAAIVKHLSSRTGVDIEQHHMLNLRSASCDVFDDILDTDTLLLVFPLFVDCLPATILELLPKLQEAAERSSRTLPAVYAVCNCGFFEAEQNATALDIVRNFCTRSGLEWRYGLGIGGGPAMGCKAENIKPSGPSKNIYAALGELSLDITKDLSTPKENTFVRACLPRSLYYLGGNLGWLVYALKNRVLFKLNTRPHEDYKNQI